MLCRNPPLKIVRIARLLAVASGDENEVDMEKEEDVAYISKKEFRHADDPPTDDC